MEVSVFPSKFVDFNKYGQQLIYQDKDVLIGVWPHILAWVVANNKIHSLFVFLRERLDILLMSMVKPCCQKLGICDWYQGQRLH